MKNMFIVSILEYQVSESRSEYWFEQIPVGVFDTLEDAKAFIAANMEEARKESQGPWMIIREVPVSPSKVKSWKADDYKETFENII